MSGGSPKCAAPSTECGPRILFVEDHSLALEALAASIDAAGDLEVVATAQSVEQGLRRVHDPHDLLLLDLGLPDGSGLDVLDTQRLAQPDARCLVMTVFTRATIPLQLSPAAKPSLSDCGAVSFTCDRNPRTYPSRNRA